MKKKPSPPQKSPRRVGAPGARRPAGPSMAEVRSRARAHGIPILRRTKQDLIRAIQIAEGNFDCFGTALSGECDQENCSWRGACLDRPHRTSP